MIFEGISDSHRNNHKLKSIIPVCLTPVIKSSEMLRNQRFWGFFLVKFRLGTIIESWRTRTNSESVRALPEESVMADRGDRLRGQTAT